MIKLYFWPTPNGYRISILFEELELRYEVKGVHIGKGEQFAADFPKVSPNKKTQAIVDPEGPGGSPYAPLESAAIKMCPAEKSGFQFMPSNVCGRVSTDFAFSILAGSLRSMDDAVYG